MRVNFYATYRNITGVRSQEITTGDTDTVQTTIEKVLQRFPQLKPHWCDAEGNFFNHLSIILNKSDINSMEEGLQTPVLQEDVIDFVPPVGGG
jgi:MoaD family protein